MIREALQYIVGMDVPHFQEFSGQLYSDKKMERLSYNPKAEPIHMTTLTSLVDYIRAEIDRYEITGTGCIDIGTITAPYTCMIIHVKSPTKVALYTPLDAERKRETLVTVEAAVPEFEFNRFVEQEKFIIGMQAKFLNNEGSDFKSNDKELLLKFAGTVESGTVTEYGDDGVSQKATVKVGIATKADALIPSPARLIPYRTFIEVEQPASEFVFRMKEDRCNGLLCGIFEADGGAWKNQAMQNIKDYLKEQLKDYPMFKIIS